MRLFKAAAMCALLVSAGAITANAQNQPAPTSPNPPQIATNPGLPYSSARTPGPKAGPSTWIPSSPSSVSPSTAAPNPEAESSTYYSKKGFGPAPN
jgi:hypothetical protein